MISGCDLAFSFIYTRNIDTLFILKVLEDVVRLFRAAFLFSILNLRSYFSSERQLVLPAYAVCICGLHMLHVCTGHCFRIVWCSLRTNQAESLDNTFVPCSSILYFIWRVVLHSSIDIVTDRCFSLYHTVYLFENKRMHNWDCPVRYMILILKMRCFTAISTVQ